jgi:acetylornithine deacetylase/succinyl-diaminopimelate desuccinylase-like protein
MQAASYAYEATFGKRPVFIRGGGSLPVVADFQRLLGLSSVLMGFGFSDDNLHAPNEKFNLGQFYGGILAGIHFLDAFGSGEGE